MYLRELKLQRYRNYATLDFAPAEGLNILVGENAQGKSNLLEAIYLLATSRSLRAGRESELVQHGADSAAIHADVVREREPDVALDIAIFSTEKKSVRVNGLRRPRVIDLLGQFNAVHFSAADLGIVSGEPSARRRYLNIEISQISPKYCYDLASYKKALEHRNRLLRDMRDAPYRDVGLDAWNDQLARYGGPLYEKRRFFLDRLAPLADEIHHDITDGRESLAINYLPSVPLGEDGGADAATEAFRAQMGRVAGEEIRRGVTLIGPQRDDVQFLVNGVDARAYGSQGQQRTVVLSLKLAQFRLMEEYVGEAPVMLLDDVMADLDDRRRSHLLHWIHRRCQTFLTCTNLRDFPTMILEGASVSRVAASTITGEPIPPQAQSNGHRPDAGATALAPEPAGEQEHGQTK